MEEKKLKILIINYEFPPLGGGGGVATYDLALEWVKHGQVDVLTSSFKDLDAYEVVDEINVHRVKVLARKSRDAASFISMLSYLPAAIFRGIKLIRKNRYDVINTHFAVPSGPVGFVLGKLFNIPNILSLHGGDIYDPSKKMSPHKSWFFRKVVRFILNRADRIVAQSSNTRDNALKYYSPKKDISIVPLAFHPPVPESILSEEPVFNKGDFVLCTLGRLVKRKSMDVIIKALSDINEDKIKLVVMGDGPERPYLEKLTSDLNISEKVKFQGYVTEDEKNYYLKNSDLFVLPSMHEGFGIVFMEAMFMGLPIVCSNHGGQVDFLTDNKNALLIGVEDVPGCRESIQKFYKDKKLYKKCSENNKKKVKDFYADKVAEKYIEIFYDTLNFIKK